jgi:hypothetical protein
MDILHGVGHENENFAVVDNRRTDPILFRDLRIGMWFLSKNKLYFRVDHANAYDIKDQTFRKLPELTTVQAVKVEIRILKNL